MYTPDGILAGAAAGILATPALLLIAGRFQRLAHGRSWRTWRTPVAAGVAATGGAAAAVQPTAGLVILHLVLFALGTIASVVDVNELRLPNTLTYPLLAAGVVLIGTSGLFSWPGSAMGGIVGGLVYGGWLLLCALLVTGGYGLGDVKVAAALGILAGMHSTLALTAAILIGQLLSIISLLATRLHRTSADTPMGPAITAGAALGILYATIAI